MRLSKLWSLSLGVLALSVSLAGPALAHKLLVSTVVDEERNLKVQAFFPDGKPAQEIPVSLTPADGSLPLSGKTDAQGIYLFADLKPGEYHVAAGDPLGHRVETKIVIPGAAQAETSPAPKEASPPSGPGNRASSPPSGGPIPWVDILAGLGFIFGLTAFVMVLKLRAELRRHASRN
jgi:hypothetical protein